MVTCPGWEVSKLGLRLLTLAYFLTDFSADEWKVLLSGTGETPALHFHWVFLTTSCTEQFEAVEEELDKRRQECQELKVRKEEDAALVTVKTPRGTLRGQAQNKEFLEIASYFFSCPEQL